MLSISHAPEAASMLNNQIDFLDFLMRQNEWVFIFLINGIKLQGYINGFDSHAVFLRPSKEALGSIPQLIYKHAIATIVKADTLKK